MKKKNKTLLIRWAEEIINLYQEENHCDGENLFMDVIVNDCDLDEYFLEAMDGIHAEEDIK